jgi:hypothetical protein
MILTVFLFAHMMGSVGKLMGPVSNNGAPTPPPATFAILTEAGSKLTTEAGIPLRLETDTP